MRNKILGKYTNSKGLYFKLTFFSIFSISVVLLIYFSTKENNFSYFISHHQTIAALLSQNFSHSVNHKKMTRITTLLSLTSKPIIDSTSSVKLNLDNNSGIHSTTRENFRSQTNEISEIQKECINQFFKQMLIPSDKEKLLDLLVHSECM